MRVITLNVNGIRSAARKGLYDWLRHQSADVVCLQEIRAPAEELEKPEFRPRYLYGYFEPAVRRGYSGVAVYTKQHPDGLVRGIGSPEFDLEGRYLEVRFGDLCIASVYMPSGSSGEHRQKAKFRFMEEFTRHLERIRADGRRYILCGDWNIAHKAIDLKNWRANQRNSGFLPEERAWMDQLFGPAGYHDAFREVNPRPDQYTWWSNRGRAREKNVGWRIDYQVVSANLAGHARAARIYRAKRFSDHAPLTVDYEL